MRAGAAGRQLPGQNLYIVRQKDMGSPKMRTSTPARRRCAVAAGPYGLSARSTSSHETVSIIEGYASIARRHHERICAGQQVRELPGVGHRLVAEAVV